GYNVHDGASSISPDGENGAGSPNAGEAVKTGAARGLRIAAGPPPRLAVVGEAIARESSIDRIQTGLRIIRGVYRKKNLKNMHPAFSTLNDRHPLSKYNNLQFY